MDRRLGLLQFVDDWMIQALALCDVRAYDVENDNLVVTLLQPTTRAVESLLRTYLPDASQSVSIHIDESFSECLEIKECVGRFFHLESSLVVTRDAVATESRKARS